MRWRWIIPFLFAVFCVAASAPASDDDELLSLFFTTPSIHEFPEFAMRDSKREFIVIASDVPAATEAEAVDIARKLASGHIASLIVERCRASTASHRQLDGIEDAVESIVSKYRSGSRLESKVAVRAIHRSYGTLYRAFLLVDVTETRLNELAANARIELRRRQEDRARAFTIRTIAFAGSILCPFLLFTVLNRLTRGYVTHVLVPTGVAVALVGVTGTYLLL